MRTILALLIGLALCAVCLGQAKPSTRPATTAAEQVRQSSDGVDYPPVSLPEVGLPPLPVIGRILGQPPEAAFGKLKVINRAKSHQAYEQLRFKPPLTYVSAPRLVCEWYVKGRAGDYLGFDIADGKVSRVLVWYKSLSDSRMGSLAAQFNRFYDDDNPSDGYEQFRAGKVRFTVGFYHGMKSMPSTGLEKTSQTVMLVEVHPVDWYLLHHEPKLEVAAAMREGRLLVGMTEREARASMHRYRAKEEHVDLNGSKSLGFYIGVEQRFSARLEDDVVVSISKW